jgi:magnesium-transporting ATPase (P-type)
MIIILAVAAGASAGIGDYKATVALAAVIIINVIIGFTQEFKAEKALNSLLKLDVPQGIWKFVLKQVSDHSNNSPCTQRRRSVYNTRSRISSW